MSRRPLLVSLAVAAVAAVVLMNWFVHEPHAVPPRSERSDGSSPVALPGPATPPSPSPSPSPKRVAADAAETDGEPTALDGTIVVTDGNGVVHPKEDGTIVPWIRRARSREEFIKEYVETGPPPRRRLDPVPVTRGRFRLELPARPEQLSIAFQITLDGRPALLDEDSGAAVLDDGRRGGTRLRCHWIECVRFHVVDRESGRELDDVSIVRRRDLRHRPYGNSGGRGATRDSYHPGRTTAVETLLERGRSPLVVHPWFVEGSMQPWDEWFVRARDHAWARINLHFDPSMARTTERTLELDAGATLIVDVQGNLPPPRVTPSGDELRPMLRLRQKTQTVGMPVRLLQDLTVAEEPAVLGELRFESLEASAITASIEFGDPFEPPRIVEQSRADLVAGGTTRVALMLTPEVVPQPVPLAGALFVPKGWEIPDGHLLIRPTSRFDVVDSKTHDLPLSQLPPLPDRPGWFAWNAGTVPPAEYEFTVEASGFAQLETIAPPGNDHVELVLAEPAHLDVDVVDEATGQKVTLAWVAWRAFHAETIQFGSGEIQLAYDPVRRHYSGVVPLGEGCVRVWDNDWTFDQLHAGATIHSGDQLLTFNVRRATGIAVELWCGTTKVPWTMPLIERCVIDSIDAPGASTDRALRDETLVVGVSAPGRYRVTVPEIPGYAPVDSFEINVPEGQFVTRTIYLWKP